VVVVGVGQSDGESGWWHAADLRLRATLPTDHSAPSSAM